MSSQFTKSYDRRMGAPGEKCMVDAEKRRCHRLGADRRRQSSSQNTELTDLSGRGLTVSLLVLHQWTRSARRAERAGILRSIAQGSAGRNRRIIAGKGGNLGPQARYMDPHHPSLVLGAIAGHCRSEGTSFRSISSLTIGMKNIRSISERVCCRLQPIMEPERTAVF